MKKLPILLVLMLVLSLFGCSKAADTAVNMTSTSDEAEYTTSVNDYEPSYAKYEVQPNISSTEGDVPSVMIDTQKIIYTANLSIQTDDYDASTSDITSLIGQYDGYIVSSDAYNLNNTENRSIYYCIRIPADNYDAFLEASKQLGKITSSSTSTEDVTDEYIDTQARINALSQQETRLLALYDKAQTVDEVLQIEYQLSDVRYEIESYQAIINNYDKLTTYCTIDIDLYESSIISPVDDSFMATIGKAFQESFLSVIAFFQGIIVLVIYTLPYIIMAAIIVAIIITVVKKKKKNNNPELDKIKAD